MEIRTAKTRQFREIVAAARESFDGKQRQRQETEKLKKTSRLVSGRKKKIFGKR